MCLAPVRSFVSFGARKGSFLFGRGLKTYPKCTFSCVCLHTRFCFTYWCFCASHCRLQSGTRLTVLQDGTELTHHYMGVIYSWNNNAPLTAARRRGTSCDLTGLARRLQEKRNRVKKKIPTALSNTASPLIGLVTSSIIMFESRLSWTSPGSVPSGCPGHKVEWSR